MSTQEKPERDQDELDLDPETVKDLELDEESADQVRGGQLTWNCCKPAAIS
jgi:hypothetical protein